MTDNISPEEIKQRLVLFLSIPAEVWTDVLKMLSRRILVQNISPVCYRLKEIRDKNVKTIHVIQNAHLFNNKLLQNDLEANQQLEDLARNTCHLASQFRLSHFTVVQENKAILRHCFELFQGCRLSLLPKNGATLVNECLTHLEAAKPISVYICLFNNPQLLFLRHPTIWNCNRVTLSLPCWYAGAMSIAMIFLDWLHYQQPVEVEDGSSDGAEQEEVRCLIIKGNFIQEAIDWLIDRCVQNLQQSQGLEDRRRFVISFSVLTSDETTGLDQFERRQNEMTGEVLLLEPDVDNANQIGTVYRLRRCLAEEAANGNEFFEKTFERNGPWDDFVANDGPMVNID